MPRWHFREGQADFRRESGLDRLQADSELRRRALAVFRLALCEAQGQSTAERRDAPPAQRERGSKAVVESRSELWQLLANALVYDPTTFAEMREAFRWVAAALTPEVRADFNDAGPRRGPNEGQPMPDHVTCAGSPQRFTDPSSILDSLHHESEARGRQEQECRQDLEERDRRLQDGTKRPQAHARLRPLSRAVYFGAGPPAAGSWMS
jgi:hypothetical protein